MLGYLKQSSGDNLTRKSDCCNYFIPIFLDNLLADANYVWINASNWGSDTNSCSYFATGALVICGVSSYCPFLDMKLILLVTFFNKLTNVGDTITSNGIFMEWLKWYNEDNSN